MGVVSWEWGRVSEDIARALFMSCGVHFWIAESVPLDTSLSNEKLISSPPNCSPHSSEHGIDCRHGCLLWGCVSGVGGWHVPSSSHTGLGLI